MVLKCSEHFMIHFEVRVRGEKSLAPRKLFKIRVEIGVRDERS